MANLHVGDILRPAFIGRGKRSFQVVKVDGATLTVRKWNVATGHSYGKEIITSYDAIVAKWELGQDNPNRVDSAPGFEIRWSQRNQPVHENWNHSPNPEGANKV